MDSDKDCIAAANAGDAAGFEAIYRRYRDWVFNLAYRFTGNRDDALDVLQETFAYFFNKFPGFELRSSMTTFLYPAVRHLSISARRKSGTFVGGEEALAALPAGAGPDDPDEKRAELARAVAGLGSQQREVLLMRFVDGMSLTEIAASLDIPEGTVKSRLHRALRSLRESEATRRYFLE